MKIQLNNEQKEPITINDIKAIKEFENITDDDAHQLVDSIKQLSLVLYQFQKQTIPTLKITNNTKLKLQRKEEYKQVA